MRTSIVWLAAGVLSFSAASFADDDYRFEGNAQDSVSGGTAGTLEPGTTGILPTFSSDVPVTTIPQTGEPNDDSISFDGSGQHVEFFGATFPFNLSGPATVEFYVRTR